jgi:hypothetical protein
MILYKTVLHNNRPLLNPDNVLEMFTERILNTAMKVLIVPTGATVSYTHSASVEYTS